jgi:hypothetical protein
MGTGLSGHFYSLLHQVSEYRVQDAAVAIVIDFHIRVQQRSGFELNHVPSAFFAFTMSLRPGHRRDPLSRPTERA